MTRMVRIVSENTTSQAQHRRTIGLLLLVCGVLATSMACGSDSDSAEETGSSTPDATSGADDSGATDGSGTSTGALTWNDDIGPFLQANCGGCHTEGGAGQFDLLAYDNARTFAPVALSAMQSGRMPPWPASDDCRDYVAERRLAPEDVAAFEAWMQGGMPIGDGEATVFAPPVLDSLRADLTARMPEPYTPVASLTDDYRCFILDLEFPEDTWVEGVSVVPGSQQVHHVLLYSMADASLQAALTADAEEDGPGYTCFGGPNPSSTGGAGTALNGNRFPNQVGAWVPGMNPRPLPDESAMLVTRGSRIIMQVHYNTIGGPVVPDNTAISVQTRDTPPAFTWRTVPIAQPSMNIAAGDPASLQSTTITNNGNTPVTIASATHHMHTLGTQIRGVITRADGTEECLLDIPEWDFQWQLQYFLESGTYAVVQPGESVRLECTYDNSAANQPVVDGVQQEPRNVQWGEGTFDEMCLMYLGVIAPYVETPPQPEGACGAAAECWSSCEPQSATCLLNCDTTEPACLTCVAQGLLRCGAIGCAGSLQAARECITPCVVGANAFDGPIGACMRDTCPDVWTGLTECLDPFVDDEACAPALAACGL